MASAQSQAATAAAFEVSFPSSRTGDPVRVPLATTRGTVYLMAIAGNSTGVYFFTSVDSVIASAGGTRISRRPLVPDRI